jgi:uncharacterized membrane protein
LNAPARSQVEDENRVLRRWTPLILRTILVTASAILIAGLIMSATTSPDYYVDHFHRAQTGATLRNVQEWSVLGHDFAQGSPHAVITIGLLVLTLVPIARVAFTFVLFIRQRDAVFIVATAYVLIGLIVGIFLGRVG